MELNGVINVYKEQGWTSFDVVNKLRNLLKVKKCGHTGTLDPNAEGVLCVCVGKATKLADKLTASDKEYETVMLLGKTTDTQDITGVVTKEMPVNVSEDKVRETVMSFIGEQEQIPPMYSAKKIKGKKLYELAREGKVVERKPSHINIYSIDILEMNLPRVKMRVSCSKGTYIRTLCNDIGDRLLCGGTMESLLRTGACGFSVTESVKIAEIKDFVDAEDYSFLHPLGEFDGIC